MVFLLVNFHSAMDFLESHGFFSLFCLYIYKQILDFFLVQSTPGRRGFIRISDDYLVVNDKTMFSLLSSILAKLRKWHKKALLFPFLCKWWVLEAVPYMIKKFFYKSKHHFRKEKNFTVKFKPSTKMIDKLVQHSSLK